MTIVVAVAVAVAGAGYAAHSLLLETSKFHLLPLKHRSAALYKDYAEDFGQLEDIVVAVESREVETSIGYAARLAAFLRAGASRRIPRRPRRHRATRPSSRPAVVSMC